MNPESVAHEPVGSGIQLDITLGGDQKKNRRIREQIMIQTNLYLEDNGYDPMEDQDSQNFSSTGMDSLDLMMLAEKIAIALHINMELTALIDYPTVGTLTKHIQTIMVREQGEEWNLTSEVEPYAPEVRVGVFTISNKLPRPASPRDSSFTKDCICNIPFTRWDVDHIDSSRGPSDISVRFGGFLESIETFDPAVWNLTVSESKHMDPQQRLLLELVSQICLGINVSQAGVFVGASTSDYHHLMQIHSNVIQFVHPASVVSSGISIIPGRLAFHLGMQGPAVATDTACSSSLVSLGIAVEMTELGTITSSYCCSSNLLICSEGYRLFESAKMLALDGRCKVIDGDSDGFSRGEAITAIGLNVLTEASRCLCTIRGISINQDGRSSSLTAPNGPAQSLLISEALRRSRGEPCDVTQLILHGTGTALGDPIEIGAAFKVYSQVKKTVSTLGLSTIKTMVGHSEAAAGSVSFAAGVVMNLDDMFFPTLHLREINANVSRLYASFSNLSKSTQIYRSIGCNVAPNNSFKIVGISSFASQGTNCHAVVEFNRKNFQCRSNGTYLWYKKHLWIMAQPRTRISFTPVRSRGRMTFQLQVPDFDSPVGLMGTFLTASIDILNILHSDARCISSVIRSSNGEDWTMSHKRYCEIVVDTTSIIASVIHSSATRRFVTGAVERLSPVARHNKPLGFLHIRIIINEQGRYQRPTDIATLAGDDKTLALAEWRFLKQFEGSKFKFRFKSASIVLFSEHKNGKLVWNDCYTRFHVSPFMRMEGYKFDLVRTQQLENANIVYDHLSMVESSLSRDERASQDCFLLVAGTTFKAHKTHPFRPFPVISSLGIFRTLAKYLTKSLRLGLKIYSRMDERLPSSHFVDLFSISSETVGYCVNRETAGRFSISCSRFTGDGTKLCTTLSSSKRGTERIFHRANRMDVPFIISGGTGGLGMLLCDYLVDQEHPLMCFSRSGTLRPNHHDYTVPTRGKSIFILQKASLSSTEDFAFSKGIAASVMASFRFIHAAGTLKDSIIQNQTIDNFWQTFAPKVTGTERILTSLTHETPLKSIVAFSSVASLMHPPGSSAYASVNKVMEVVISLWMNKGLESFSIQWGAWKTIGMVSDSEMVASTMKVLKISLIEPSVGIRAFARIIESFENLKSIYSCVPFQKSYEELSPVKVTNDQSQQRQYSPTKDTRHVQKHQQITKETVARVIYRLVSNILEKENIGMFESLAHFGADSLSAIEIQSALSNEFCISLPATFLFNYPTITAMADSICNEMGLRSNDVEFPILSRQHDKHVDESKLDPISIQAMIIRKPGILSDDGFDTPDHTKKVSIERWDSDFFHFSDFGVRFGKFLEDYKAFDAELFKISARESSLMDPQQRMLLEDSVAILRYVDGRPCEDIAVLVGMSFWDYSLVSEQHLLQNGLALKLTGRNLSVSSGRISYIHGYNGPSMTIDTACSSSLVAIHIGTRLILSDNVQSVRVGSAMLSLSLDVVKCLSSASMTADHGRSQTLDSRASGYGRGEATSFLSISRSKGGQAIVDSTAVNQDGRSARLTAPHGPSQVKLLLQLYQSKSIYCSDACIHELHGTGTQLGDPIEISALVKFLQIMQKTADKDLYALPLYISATKTIYGHSEPVAGMIGIHSVLRQLGNLSHDPVLHLTQISPHLTEALDKAYRDLIPSRTHAPIISKHLPSISSISSFAFQGTNASIIVHGKMKITNQGDLKDLQKFSGYQGKEHWFIGPIPHYIIPKTFENFSCIWSVKRKVISMSKMMEHHVLGKALLPGMAILKIMSDVFASSCFDPERELVLLKQSTISLPISLSDDIDLMVRNRLDDSKVSIFGRGAMQVDEFATGFCEMKLPSVSIERISNFSYISKLSHLLRKYPIVSLGALKMSNDTENMQYPSIESMDASTHIAAYHERIRRKDISIPVSCVLTCMKSWKINAHSLGSVSGLVSCIDNLKTEPIRDYKIGYDLSNTVVFESLRSKRVRKSINTYDVWHINQEAFISSLQSRVMLQRLDHPAFIARGNKSFFASLLSQKLNLKYIDISLCALVQEYIRSKVRSKVVEFVLPSTIEKSLVTSQAQVASKELGLLYDVSECEPNGIGSVPFVKSTVGISYIKSPRNLGGGYIGKAVEYNTIVIGGTKGIGLLYSEWVRSCNKAGSLSIRILGRNGFLRGSLVHQSKSLKTISVSSYNCSMKSDNDSMVQESLLTDVSKFSVFFSAGIIEDGYFMTSSLKSYRSTFSSKYNGFMALSFALLPSLPLLGLLSTSTMSIDIGNIGQANYVAANSAMEIQSKRIQDTGLQSRSIRYGPWRDLGLLFNRQDTLNFLGHIGLQPMNAVQGLSATIQFLNAEDWISSIGIVEWRKAPKFLRDNLDLKVTEAEYDPITHQKEILPGPKIPNISTKSRDFVHADRIYDIVHDTLRGALGESFVSDEEPFFELGVDSMSLIDIRNNLSTALGFSLPPTYLFDYPSVSKLVAALTEGFAEDLDRPMQKQSDNFKYIYISSISSKIPGSNSHSFADLSKVFLEEKNLQIPIPIDRWDNDSLFSPLKDAETIYTNFASFFDDIWAFDSVLFGLNPTDAWYIDPQCRILLSITASAFQSLDTGFSRTRKNTSTFVGCMFFDYLRIFEAKRQSVNSSAVLGNGLPYLCGRLCYSFDLSGTSMGIDTACSSSLVALHAGRNDILSNCSHFSVCCGVNAILSPNTSAILCKLKALSRTGRSLSLDSSADGYGRGEACVSCVISNERLESHFGILRSTFVNQDGRSASMTAPNGPSQEKLIKSCTLEGDIALEDVLTLSIHGTGTLLGDPLEIQALSNVFDNKKAPIYLVSNKALFGHCEGAAGSTGLLNSLFNLSQNVSNGIHTLRTLNSYVSYSVQKNVVNPIRSSMSILGVASEISASGTSSFGMSGTNAHAMFSWAEEQKFSISSKGPKWMQAKHFRSPMFMESYRFYVGYSINNHKALIQASFTTTQMGNWLNHKIWGVSILPAAAQIDLSCRVTSKIYPLKIEFFINRAIFINPCSLGHETEIFFSVDLSSGSMDIICGTVSGMPCASMWMGVQVERRRIHSSFGVLNWHFFPKNKIHIPLGCISDVQNPQRSDLISEIDTSFHLSSLCQPVCGIPSEASGIQIHLKPLLDTNVTLKAKSFAFSPYESYNSLQRDEIRATCFLRAGMMQSKPLKVEAKSKVRDVWVAQPSGLINEISNASFSVLNLCGSPQNSGRCGRSPSTLECMHAFEILGKLIQEGPEHLKSAIREYPHLLVDSFIMRVLLRVYQSESGVHLPRHSRSTNDAFLTMEMDRSSGSREPEVWYHSFCRTQSAFLTSLGGLGSLLVNFLKFSSSELSLQACSRRRVDVCNPILLSYMITISNNDLRYREDMTANFKGKNFFHVFHTAGALRDSLIARVKAEDILETLSPKLNIIENIVSTLNGRSIRAICSFSSIAGHFGSAGQGSYAVSNSILDLFSRNAFAQGLPCYCIQWGLWNQMGMAASLDSGTTRRLSSSGFLGLSATEGLYALHLCLLKMQRVFVPELLVTKIDLAGLLDHVASREHLTHVSEAVLQKLSHCKTTSIQAKNLREEQDESRLKLDKTSISQILEKTILEHLDADICLDKSIPILQMGFDSVSSVELAQSIAYSMNINLPYTFIYDNPMFDDMVSFILKSCTEVAIHPQARDILQETNEEKVETLSIVSIAAQYPCEEETSVHTFEKDTIKSITRADASPFASLDEYYVSLGSTFKHEEIYAFDREIFGLSKTVATNVDPNIRWALTLHAQIIHPSTDEQNTRTGVFLGWMWSHEFIDRFWGLCSHSIGFPSLVTGNSAAFAVGYVAYLFRLSGPCVPIDTACSSTLVALHLSNQAIRNNDCEKATVSGINSFMSPSSWRQIYSISATSIDGRSKTFDATANGYGRGESFVSALIDKNLDNRQQAVAILGTAVLTVAQRSSLTSPHGPSQAKVIHLAIENSGNQIIRSVALHGTGTNLGDPIEAQSLTESLRARQGSKQNVNLFSPKSAVGHTEGAAGITNIVACIQSYKQGINIKLHHLRHINPLILSHLGQGIVVQREQGPLEYQDFECTGASSFGMSGVNSHVVLRNSPGLPGSSLFRSYRLSNTQVPLELVPEPLFFYSKYQTWFLSSKITSPLISWIHDHVVLDKSVLPGTFFIEATRGCSKILLGDGQIILSKFSWIQPCSADHLSSIGIRAEFNGQLSFSDQRGTPLCSASVGSRSYVPLEYSRPTVKLRSLKTYSTIFPSSQDSMAILGDLGARRLGGYESLGLLARLDALLHLTAVLSQMIYLPVSLETLVLFRDCILPQKIVSMIPGFTNKHSLINLALGTQRGNAEVMYSNLRGRRPGLSNDVSTADILYHFESQACSPSSIETSTCQTSIPNQGLFLFVDNVFLKNLGKDHLTNYLTQLSILQNTHGHNVGFVCWSNPTVQPFGPASSEMHFEISDVMGSCYQAESLGNGSTRVLSQFQNKVIHEIGTGKSHEFASTRFRNMTYAQRKTSDALPSKLFISSIGQSSIPACPTRSSKNIEVRVASVGLNFRDILMALGMYPSSYGCADIGSDFAGYVERSHCSNIQVGDRIFGHSKGVFREKISVHPNLVCPVPPTLSMEDASGLPTIFLTALQCLKILPKCFIRNILVHASSGGLGLALVQLARAEGIHILTTAGSTTKRAYLRKQGLMAHSSRTVNFIDYVMYLDDASVDSVINTLTSPGMISASSALLSRGGYFVEVSKRDIFSSVRIAQERSDIIYNLLAVDLMPEFFVQKGLRDLCALLAKGNFKPMTGVRFSLSNIQKAAAAFKSPYNIGKIISSSGQGQNTSRNVWIISGGLGALGKLTGKYFLAQGNDVVIPARRVAPFADNSSQLRSLLTIILADVTHRGNIQEILEVDICQTNFAGIVHSSGALRDSAMILTKPRSSREVFAPKSTPILNFLSNLHKQRIFSIVSYSSVSSVWANAGQSNYSFVNRILDFLSYKSSQQGINHHVINWGPWLGLGMAANLNSSRLISKGIYPINPNQASTILNFIFKAVVSETSPSQHLIVSLSESRSVKLINGPPLESLEIKDASLNKSTDAKDVPKNSFYTLEKVKDVLRELVLGVLGHIPDESLPLMAAGLDSLGLIDFVNGLKEMFQQDFSPTFPFDYPTVSAMAETIFKSTERNEDLCSPVLKTVYSSNTVLDSKSISILDASCMHPTTNGGQDCSRSTPIDRWDIEHTQNFLNHEPIYALRFGGFVRNIDMFDNDAFGISPREATILDPQHRCLISTLFAIRGEYIADTSIAIGIARLEDPWYILYAIEQSIKESNGLVSTSRSSGAAAGRLSYTFNYKGPCVSVDTACSSSLVALKIVCDSFQDTLSHAFVGGVSLPMNLRTSMMLAASSMLALDGRCKTLDRTANGYGRAEGCSVIKLECKLKKRGYPLTRDVLARLSSYDSNQDGSSSSLTAPYGPSQESLLVKVMQKAGIEPSQVNLCGMHGTGTILGDPIEMNALTRAMKMTEYPLNILSSKSKYGHAETVSGLFGLTLNVSILARREIQPLPQLRELNNHIRRALDGFNKQTNIPRLNQGFVQNSKNTFAVVSAFAFQGSNASALIERDADESHVSGKHFKGFPKFCASHPSGHPLFKRLHFKSDIMIFSCAYLHQGYRLLDHCVRHSPIMPAAGFLEILQATISVLTRETSTVFRKIVFMRPANLSPMLFNISWTSLDEEAVIYETLETRHQSDLCKANLSHNQRSKPVTIENRGKVKKPVIQLSASTLVNVTKAALGQVQHESEYYTYILDSSWHLLVTNKFVGTELLLPGTMAAFAGKKQYRRFGGERKIFTTLILQDNDPREPSKSILLNSQTDYIATTPLKSVGLSLKSVSTSKIANSLVRIPLPFSIPEVQVNTIPSFQKSEPRLTVTNRCLNHLIVPVVVQSLQMWPRQKPFSLETTKAANVLGNRRSYPHVDECIKAINKIQEGPPISQITFDTQVSTMSNVSLNPKRSLELPVGITMYISGGSGAIGSLISACMTPYNINILVFSRRHPKLSYPVVATEANRLWELQMIDVTEASTTETASNALSNSASKIIGINMAGVLQDQNLYNIDIKSLRAVIAPKHMGVHLIPLRLGCANLSQLIHFGSIASIIGNDSQTSYIMANTILTSISNRLSTSGTPSSVIHWGPWSLQDGMASPSIQRKMQRQGVPMVSSVEGLLLLEVLLQTTQCEPEYFAFDFSAYKNEEIVRNENLHRIEAFPASVEDIEASIQKIVTNLTGDWFENTSTKFIDRGLDSISSIAFSEALNFEFDIDIPSTVIFDFPTMEDLSAYIMGELEPRQRKVDTVAPRLGNLNESLVVQISGIASKFPLTREGMSIDHAWRQGHEVQTSTPSSRWDIEHHYHPLKKTNKSYVRYSGWLRNIDLFERKLFNLMPEESVALDPQSRILLELTGQIKCSQNLDPLCSSFLGVMYNEYLDAVLAPANLANSLPQSITSNGMSFLAGRISYHHGIGGKAVACDTACSSSLVAIHMGSKSVKEENRMAIGHGINIMLSPQTTARICLLNALSPTGRCKTADSSANGYGRSESGCTVCLMPILIGESPGHPIIIGSGVNQNVNSSGLTAPHGPSQVKLIVSVQQQHVFDARNSISSLHGTGTALGDPIEFSSLHQSQNYFHKRFGQVQIAPRTIIATKSCVGHMEGTAGLCGLVLPLQNTEGRYASPNLHLRNINQHISWPKSAEQEMFLPRQTTPLVQVYDSPLFCSTSSFGMSGTNAHLVCSDPLAQNKPRDDTLAWHKERNWPIEHPGHVCLAWSSVRHGCLTFSVHINERRASWLYEHQVNQTSILAAAAVLAVFNHIATMLKDTFARVLQNISFNKPILLNGEELTVETFRGSEGISMSKNGSVTSKAFIFQLASDVQALGKANTAARVKCPYLPNLFTNLVSNLAKISRSTLDAELVEIFGDPCAVDASLHLAPGTSGHSSQTRIPVSIGIFQSRDDQSQQSHAICINDLSRCHVLGNSARQTLGNVLTKHMHADIPVASRQISKFQAALYEPVDAIAQFFTGSWKDVSRPTFTIGNARKSVFAVLSWYQALSTVSSFSIESSKNHSIEFAFDSIDHTEASLMISSLLKTAPKDMPEARMVHVERSRLIETTTSISGHHMSQYRKIQEGVLFPKHLPTLTSHINTISLVTGGFGGLGALTSSWLAYLGGNIIRLGRRTVRRSKAYDGCTSETLVQADVGFSADLSNAFSNDIRLGNLYHSSGTVKDQLIRHIQVQHVRESTASKSTKFRNLIEAMAHHGANSIVAYSSISSILGNRGQLAYSYANSNLNNIAQQGRYCGLNAISLAWGPWSSLGMTSGIDPSVFERLGIFCIDPSEGLRLLHMANLYLYSVPTSHIIVAGCFDGLDISDGVGNQEQENGEKITSSSSINVMPDNPGSVFAPKIVLNALQTVFGPSIVDESDLPDMDSLQSVSVTDRLSSILRVEISPTALYDHPSIPDLHQHLIHLVGDHNKQKDESTPATYPNGERDQEERDFREYEVTNPSRPKTFSLRENYYCFPQLHDLNRMSEHDLSKVHNFVIGKEGVGEIRFLCPVNLQKADLRRSISISKRSMTLSGDRNKHPGQGLNHPALLVFRGASPKVFDSPYSRRRLRSRLLQACQRVGGILVHLDEIHCEFIIKVDDWLV